MPRTFVYDMEVISPLGCSLEEHVEGLVNGRSGGSFISRFNAKSFPTTFGCEVKTDLQYLQKVVNPAIAPCLPYDRKFELFCAVVERLFPRVAGKVLQVIPDQIGTFMGAGMESVDAGYLGDHFQIDEKKSIQAFLLNNKKLPYINRVLNPSHLGTVYAASRFNAAGPRQTNLSACAASAQALGAAFLAISQGTCRCAIVGGYDSTINPFTLAAFSQLDMISTRNSDPAIASRPFDLHRDGFVPGEGAGIIILAEESLDNIFGTPLAEIAGYGSSLDAYKVTAPHENGLGARLAIERCLASAGWEPSSIDYINAHGTSTPLNDVVEYRALRDLFGDTLAEIPVSSTKSQIGHCIAAAGIVECISVISAMKKQVVPPNINVTRQDPACPLRLITKPGENLTIRRALSNSFALAGQNAVVAIAAV
jgi:3-oxoacyl-[acyl-carrier-protein] synthase II